MEMKSSIAILIAAATALAWATPSTAQWFNQWEREGRTPFWEQPQQRQPAYRNQPSWGGAWDDYYYGGGQQRARVLRGGGRPYIAPEAPKIVAFDSTFEPNSIVIDTAGRKLYYVLSDSEAYAYPISVGRQGFTWTGTEVISRVADWPDWHPPKEMIARDPKLPDKMYGGIRNPLGAKALYLGNTLYRIHGTNDASTIGQAASSGCFRMLNRHVVHLAGLAKVGTPVTVVKNLPAAVAMAPKAQDQTRTFAQ